MKSLVFSLAICSVLQAFAAAKVDRVLVRQNWPWSKDVTVEYEVSGATAPAAVSFAYFDGETPLAASETAVVSGDNLWAGNGPHKVTFDPVEMFGSRAFADFRVEVTLGEENAKMADHLYRIVDLDTGAITDLSRADFYNNKGYGTFVTNIKDIHKDFVTSLEDVFVWTGVADNPEYKTSKLVLRYIPASKGGIWLMGRDGDTTAEPAHHVKLTEDYYLGVFQVTKEQYFRMMGTEYAEGLGFRPANGISYTLWHGSGTTYETWPASRDVDPDSFMGKLQTLVGKRMFFDLPTEAQWEYAARAGTTTGNYAGSDGRFSLIAWANSSNTGPTDVGTLLPNAFGLYDVQGNVWEWCIDWYGAFEADPESGYVEDPRGVTADQSIEDKSGNKTHVNRGNGYAPGTSTVKNISRRGSDRVGAYGGSLGARVWAAADAPAASGASTAVSATVDSVAVSQNAPFSKDVTVDYVVSGATAPVAVSFEFYDGERKLLQADAAQIRGDTAYAKNGANRITFDPSTLFATEADALAAFRVRVLLGEENAAMADHLYRIVDLDTGDVTDLSRMDFYNNKGYGAFETSYQAIDPAFSTSLKDVFIWTGVCDNPIYKTSKLVLRYIPASTYGEWTLGSDTFTNAKPPHRVKLTEDFYMGVFEVTQEQYHRITGSYGGSQASSVQVDGEWGNHLYLPAGAVSWSAMMGDVSAWPVSREPTSGSFLGKLRTRVNGRIAFSLPTDAEWEFAARAGTDSRFNCGPDGSYTKTGRTGQGNEYPFAVGSLLPNALGLYDTFGNVNEWCVDWYKSGYDTIGGVEENPKGIAQTDAAVDANLPCHPYRGAGYSSTYSQSGSAFRGGYNNVKAYAVLGGRVWAPADK